MKPGNIGSPGDSELVRVKNALVIHEYPGVEVDLHCVSSETTAVLPLRLTLIIIRLGSKALSPSSLAPHSIQAMLLGIIHRPDCWCLCCLAAVYRGGM
jgi:hypothetical protein